MSETNPTLYDKMPDYVETMFNVFQLVNRKAEKQQDKRLKKLNEPDSINLIPVFEYISHNNIELYDFTKIEMTDVDTTKNSDLERFVLTHVYYITQSKA